MREDGKGLFVLAATSNPEAREVQTALRNDGKSVAADIVASAVEWNRDAALGSRVGSVGVVLGATLDLATYGIDAAVPTNGPLLPVLAPGFGHQGAQIDEADAIFGSYSAALLANESRGILSGGPNGLSDRIRHRTEVIREALTD